MIFEEINIENLFSYQGKQTFNFAPDNSKKNVVLISGRNGYGKTSFINSVKLLFLGTGFGAGDELRREVQAGRNIKPRDYILGWGDEWLGILNRKARIKPNSQFSVSAVWKEAQGHVFLRRSWNLNGEETLEIEPRFQLDEEVELPLQGEAAEKFLESRLPARIIPLFFYDGEKVQALAEANREGQLEQIERLLDLTLIDRLDEYLGKAVTKTRQLADPLIDAKLKGKEGELTTARANHRRIQIEIEEKDAEIAETNRSITQLERQLSGARELALQKEESRLRERKNALKGQIEADGQTLFDTLCPTAPLLANPDLVTRAIAELEKLIEHPNQKLNTEIDKILKMLPIQLLDLPPQPIPDITSSQREFFRDRLVGLLGQYKTEARHLLDGLFNLRPDLAAELSEKMAQFKYKADIRSNLAESLQKISKYKREVIEVEAKLSDVSNLAPEERDRFLAREEEMKRLRAQLDIQNQDKGRLQDQLRIVEGVLDKLQKDLFSLEKAQVQNRRAQARIDLGGKLRNLFVKYRTLQMEKHRSDIEVAMNRHFKTLMTSHGMIARISLGERFEMRYYTEDGALVGMGSLAAGMKQLLAQALLWTLKEVAQHPAPVIIDTPLARIDRQHQEQLLRHYYPAVAEQVIILPTDSELDAQKYALLKPYVYREYRLVNIDGESTRPVEAPMY